ncbi:hypothetical protein ACFU8I_02050 [Streptomyces sp. NPDC057540]|uniref:hypothetical protein n=1 Tax=Streptomyces sp. NPDC057540 TaxID=3346160 RepID=UPI0036A26E5B
MQHVLGDDGQPTAVLALAGRRVESFEGRLPDVLPLGLRHRREERECGGVAAEALHLVDGEDDAAVRGVGLDLACESERGLELGVAPDAGADLLGEHLVEYPELALSDDEFCESGRSFVVAGPSLLILLGQRTVHERSRLCCQAFKIVCTY